MLGLSALMPAVAAIVTTEGPARWAVIATAIVSAGASAIAGHVARRGAPLLREEGALRVESADPVELARVAAIGVTLDRNGSVVGTLLDARDAPLLEILARTPAELDARIAALDLSRCAWRTPEPTTARGEMLAWRALWGVSACASLVLGFQPLSSIVATALLAPRWLLSLPGARVITGEDGVTVERGRESTHYRIEEIEDARHRDDVELVMRDGRVIRLGLGGAPTKPTAALMEHVATRVRSAVGRHRSTHRRAAPALPDTSTARIEDGGYRVAPAPSAELLVRVATDPTSAPEARVRAAEQLRARGASASRGALREAAHASAHPRVRVALEAAAEAPDPLAELDADEPRTRRR